MDEGPPLETVGLVGGDTRVATAVRDAGWRPVEGAPATVLAADPDAVLAVGQSALLALGRRCPTPPILAVGECPGFASVSDRAVVTALEALVAGDATTRTHPVLDVSVRDERAGRACLDVTVEAAEVGRISAFALAAGDRSLGSLRADGVVVATPAGTQGYAARLGAPTVAPGTGVLAVEPISQFATVRNRWITADESVTVSVTRDEVPVQVLADDREVAEAAAEDVVSIARAGGFETVVVSGASASPGRGDAELEKH